MAEIQGWEDDGILPLSFGLKASLSIFVPAGFAS